MFDTDLGKPIKVVAHEQSVASIRLSEKHMDQVKKLLEENGVPNWMAHNLISYERGPFIGRIYLRRVKDAEKAQAILDLVN